MSYNRDENYRSRGESGSGSKSRSESRSGSSRWGERRHDDGPNNSNSNQRPRNTNHTSTSTSASSGVSDDQALHALLASADQHQETKRQEEKNKHVGIGGSRLDRRGSRGSRWDEGKGKGSDRDRDTTNTRDGHRGDRGGRDNNNNYYQPRQDKNKNKDSSANANANDYYQPQSKRQRRQNDRDSEKNDSKYSWGGTENETANEDGDDTEEAINPEDVQKPNFGLSGALANDETTGNLYNGVLLKFSEPPEARVPNTRWRFYVFKKKKDGQGGSQNNKPGNKDGKGNGKDDDSNSGELLQVMHIGKQSAYLFGRERKVADIPVDHPSLSKQHCVLQYRALPDKNDREQTLRCKPYMMDLGSTNGTFINGIRIDDARYYELRKGDVITLGASSREYVLLTENSTSADL